MPNLALLALEASDGTVVLTSITLVFAMLVALCLIITLEGKIFDNINNKRTASLPRRRLLLPPLPRLPLPPSPPPLRPRLTTAPFPARSSPRSPLPWPWSAAAMPSFAASSAFPSLPPVPAAVPGATPACVSTRRPLCKEVRKWLLFLPTLQRFCKVRLGTDLLHRGRLEVRRHAGSGLRAAVSGHRQAV